MTSEETDLGKFIWRLETETEFICVPNNFLVLDDQCTVIGVDKKENKLEILPSKGIIIQNIQYLRYIDWVREKEGFIYSKLEKNISE